VAALDQLTALVPSIQHRRLDLQPGDAAARCVFELRKGDPLVDEARAVCHAVEPANGFDVVYTDDFAVVAADQHDAVLARPQQRPRNDNLHHAVRVDGGVQPLK
jgi:hypothetical protein